MRKTTLDNYFDGPAQIEASSQIEINGNLLDTSAITRLAGCPKGGHVALFVDDEVVTLPTKCKGFIRGTNTIELRRDADGFYLYLEYVWYDDSAPSGFGAVAFLKMAEEAAKIGLTRIELLAGGGTGVKQGEWAEAYVGYYAWARFGFDAELWPVTLDLLKDVPELAGCTMVSEVMERNPGWWRKNGDGCDMVFDLAEGSHSWQILLKYLTVKGLLA